MGGCRNANRPNNPRSHPMSREFEIEFEPGDVIRPEFDPENNLVSLVVTREGLESLRAEVCEEANPEGSSGEDAVPRGPLEGDIEELRARVSELERRFLEQSSGNE